MHISLNYFVFAYLYCKPRSRRRRGFS